MSKHSKNNRGSSVFTYMERKMLKQKNLWGDIKGRLSQDNQKSFEQCSICLSFVVNPVCCYKGSIFCKQCLLENFLFQKQEIKKLTKKYEEQEKEKLDSKEKKDEDDEEEEIGKDKDKNNIINYNKINNELQPIKPNKKEKKLNKIKIDSKKDINDNIRHTDEEIPNLYINKNKFTYDKEALEYDDDPAYTRMINEGKL